MQMGQFSNTYGSLSQGELDGVSITGGPYEAVHDAATEGEGEGLRRERRLLARGALQEQAGLGDLERIHGEEGFCDVGVVVVVAERRGGTSCC